MRVNRDSGFKAPMPSDIKVIKWSQQKKTVISFCSVPILERIYRVFKLGFNFDTSKNEGWIKKLPGVRWKSKF